MAVLFVLALKLKFKNGSLHGEEVSAVVHVRADVDLLPGGDRCGLCDQLHGPGGRQLPHAVRHRGPHHRIHQCTDGAQIMEQKHLRMGQV